MHDLATAVNKRLAVREERNWRQFHTPRNLAAALAIEVGELQEAMLWKTDEEDWTQISGECIAVNPDREPRVPYLSKKNCRLRGSFDLQRGQEARTYP
jgi:hypothetical protein